MRERERERACDDIIRMICKSELQEREVIVYDNVNSHINMRQFERSKDNEFSQLKIPLTIRFSTLKT
jgi:hypothetical protein